MNLIQSLLQLKNSPEKLVQQLKAADAETLYELISQSGMTGPLGAEYEAIRETAIAIHQARLTEGLVTTMKQLDTSATILYYVGIVIAVVIGIAQIVVPLLMKR